MRGKRSYKSRVKKTFSRTRRKSRRKDRIISNYGTARGGIRL